MESRAHTEAGDEHAHFPIGRGAIALLATLALSFAVLVALGWRLAVYSTPVSDLVGYFLPKYQYAADRIASGELPLWNPYEFGGIPFLATIQPAVFYPPLRASYALLSGETAYAACFLFHVALGAAATLLWMRSLGAGLWPSVLAATWVVQPSWLMRGWDHPVLVWGPPWIPLLLLLVRRAVRTPDLRGAALLALVAAALAVSGYPPMILATGYLLALALPLFAWEARHDARFAPRRTAGALAIAALVALLVASAQLAPTAELASMTDRADEAAEVADAIEMVASDIPAVAFFIGMPRTTFLEAAASLWSRFGPALLALVAAGAVLRWRSPLVWFALASVVLSTLLPFDAYKKLPLYGLVRSASEWDFIAPLAVYAAAGLGLDAVLRQWRPSPRIAATLAVVLVMLAIGWNWRETGRRWPERQLDSTLRVPSWMERACDLQGDGAYRAFWTIGQLRGSLMASRVRSIGGFEQSLLPARTAALVAALGIPNGGYAQNMATLIARHRDAMTRLALRCVLQNARTLGRAGFVPLHDPEGQPAAYLSPRALPRARLAFESRVARSPEEALDLLSSAPPDAVVLEEEGEPLPACPDREPSVVRVERDEPEHVVVRVETPCPTHLVLADTALPGWTATLDGRSVPILRADYAFRAVRVPAGRHEVAFSYAPWSAPVGLALSTLGLLLAGAMVAFGNAKVRSRRSRGP